MSLRDELVDIYEETLSSLPGDVLVREALAGKRSELPSDPRQIVVIALGKAAGAMAYGAVAALGPCTGITVGPVGVDAPGGFEIVEGEHPLPGPRSIRAGIRLLAFAASIRPDQTALVLLSGGASSLAEALPSSLSLLDLSLTTKLLLGAGAPIEEVNAVRKHLSRTKGGRLAAACTAGRIEVIALSDVEGDDLGVIGSGPFSPDPSTFANAVEIVERRGIADQLPKSVMAHLRAAQDESPKPGDPLFKRVNASVIAGPQRLAEAAEMQARKRGFEVIAWPRFMKGDVHRVAAQYVDWLERSPPGKRTILIAAGEPTVVLPSQAGSGGRSQQLALLMAVALDRSPLGPVAFLAAGSDGRDGTSDHAGAVVDWQTGERARALGFDMEEAVRSASSAAACEILGASIPAVASETNLTDLHLLAVG